MNSGPDVTETNLLCFLYEITKEEELCRHYIEDAMESHDELLAEFYREIQAQNHLRMWRIDEFLHRYSVQAVPKP